MRHHTDQDDEFAGMSPDEVLLVRARRTARELARRLEAEPFEEGTVHALRAYVAGPAWPAVQAWGRLRRLPTRVLCARLRRLRGERP
ncbi:MULTISPECIES: hypothetical protein [Streptomyces]|uniref:hypothetical protein n=1 Tax=Streptomyces TaxID=1883 RepID=UPI0004C729EB|nr:MULTISPECIES: hypothetical protein [Streptomyces]